MKHYYKNNALENETINFVPSTWLIILLFVHKEFQLSINTWLLNVYAMKIDSEILHYVGYN